MILSRSSSSVAVPDTEDIVGREERARVRAVRTSVLLRLERAEVLFPQHVWAEDDKVELLQLGEHRQRADEGLIVAQCVEVQHARLERSFLAGVPA